jgi:hypothetical protein
MNAPTVSDLIFSDVALLLDIEPTYKHVPLALPTRWSSNTDLSRGWWREPFDSGNTHEILAYLLHLDVCDISRNIAVVV